MGCRRRRLEPGQVAPERGASSMNPYTTRTQARIQPRDVTNALFTDAFTAAASMAVLERMRTYQAGAEVHWLLKEHDVRPVAAASRVAMVRQVIGATLVRAGEHLAAAHPRGAS